MIIGTHLLVYSRNPRADRDFLRTVLKLAHVDAGGGWLIFALPPSEVAVHPGKNNEHELYLICDDIATFIARMARRHIRCGRVQDQGWGLLTRLTLPGGGKLGVYEPRHARPERSKPPAARRAPRSARRRQTAR